MPALQARYRSHTCGALRANDIGSTARLSGWVHRVRDHGGHFIRLPGSDDLWWMGIDAVTGGLDSADLAAAERYYNQALKLEPTHRGALEYSGELYLMLGQLPQAESRLATLTKVCSGACEELDDLKAAVAKFKANGNKWSPK